MDSDADQPEEPSTPEDLSDDLPAPDAEASPDENESDRHKWLTAGVSSVGAASFFSDSVHEITTELLPSFVTSVLHGLAASLGIIEGVSDALMGVMKLVGGPVANDPERRRRMAVGGYLVTALATGVIGFATTLWQA